MKRSIFCLLFLSSVTCANGDEGLKKLAFNGADSFGKAVGGEVGKTLVSSVAKIFSSENTLKEAVANIKLKKEELELQERAERLNLIKNLGDLDKKDQESGLNEKEMAQRDNIKLCIAVLMEKQGN